MFKEIKYEGTLEEKYSYLIKDLYELTENVDNTISNLSNSSALLNYFLGNINWVGFYIYDKQNNGLILGPFQGLPACVKIDIGKGVCGYCAKEKRTVIVEDVNTFQGHIACDSKSKSEVVIPIFKKGEFYGVLDIDSPILNRFSKKEVSYLEEFIKELEKHI